MRTEQLASSPQTAVVARGLTKRFRGVTAVDGIDLDVGAGDFFGVLGPNGAGKSSTMRMLSCVSLPTAGRLLVLGMDPRRDESRIRARLGIVAQANNLDRDLTAFDNLMTYARYFGQSRAQSRQVAAELLGFVRLGERASSRVDELSGGMQRRLAIARALVNTPDLVFLDEPTTGLDPQARHLLWERLFQLKAKGTTLVLSTHYMDEAEYLCDRIVVMDRGRIVGNGSPTALIKEYAGPEVVQLRFAEATTATVARALSGIAEHLDVLADRVLLYTADATAAAAEVHRRGVQPAETLIRRSTLEDVFLRLTGRTLVE